MDTLNHAKVNDIYVMHSIRYPLTHLCVPKSLSERIECAINKIHCINENNMIEEPEVKPKAYVKRRIK